MTILRLDGEQILRAVAFALRAHGEQKRKYTGESYIVHCLEVARIVAETCLSPTTDMVVAAILHDTLEDTDTTAGEIRNCFGPQVATFVIQVSDVSESADGNRTKRKEIDRKWYGQASREAQTIKLADLIDNSQSILRLDPNFAKVYVSEKKALLKVLTRGDRILHKWASDIVREWEQNQLD